MGKEDSDSSGLQVDRAHEAPEVYSGPVRHDGSHFESGLETYTPPAASPQPPITESSAPYYASTAKMSQYEHDVAAQQTHPYGGLNGGQFPPYKDETQTDGSEIPEGQNGHHYEQPRNKKVFGLARWLFITIVVVVLVIVLAAVLGGVLGSQNHKSSSSSSSTSPGTPSPTGTSSALPAINTNTGFSLVRSAGGDTTYSYYQDPTGRIIENDLNTNNVWSIKGSDNVPDSAVVTESSWSGSPLAAVSYTYNGDTVRQVFFVSTQGLVSTTYASGSGGWIEPYQIYSDDQAAANSVSMTAIADTNPNALNGIRMYYASTAGYIQEIGTDFNNGGPSNLTWNKWAAFPGSDIGSGVASVLVDNTNHLYFRNSSTGDVQRWEWDYTVPGPWYTDSSGAQDIVEGSDLAATSSQSDTDILFFAGSGNQLMETAIVSGSWQATENVAQIAAGSKFTASYYNTSSSTTTGSLIMFQSANNTEAMSYELRSNYPSNVIWSGTA